VGDVTSPAPPLWRMPRLVPLLLIVLLVVSAVAVLVGGTARARRDDRDMTALIHTVQVQRGLDEQRRRDEARHFAEEDFPTRYQHVLAADRDTDDAYRRWSTVPGTQFSTVAEAVQRCFGAVDTYDVVATRYSRDLFSGTAPAGIDLSDPRTDCGRAFWSRL
jgi:hypothetical protein